MSIQDIQILQNHRSYRSRLEARWAAFFDRLGWKYEYEPFDLPGWSPDFMLFGKHPILVEVKPVVSFPDSAAVKILEALSQAPDIECSELLIVGASLLTSEYADNPQIGWTVEANLDESGEVVYGGPAVLGLWCDGKGKYGYCSADQSFRDRISGGYDGGCWGAYGEPDIQLLQRYWSEAANEVQRTK